MISCVSLRHEGFYFLGYPDLRGLTLWSDPRVGDFTCLPIYRCGNRGYGLDID